MPNINLHPTPYSSWDEKTGWVAFKQGDLTAFKQLYERYFPQLVAYGRRLTADTQLLENAIQDVFVDLWRRREFLTDVENVKSYLIRSLRNQIIRNHRHDMFDGAEDIDGFLDLLVALSSEQIAIDQELAADQITRVRSAIDRLANRQKEAIHLRFYQGMGLDEMASVMQLSKQSVSNLLHKAVVALRAVIRLGVLLFFGLAG